MPRKSYNYDVNISAKIDSRGVTKGAGEVEKELSGIEKRALKTAAAFEKLSKAIEMAEKANLAAASKIPAIDNSRIGGGTSGRWTPELQAIAKVSALTTKYENQLAKLKGNDTELAKLNRTLSQPGVAAKIDETTKALLRQKAAAVDSEKTISQSAKNSSSIFSSVLGGSFFGSLGANAVSFFVGKLAQLPGAISAIVGEAVRLSESKINALKGLESIASFKGVNTDDAQAAVQNFRLVKAGVVDVSEATIALKNLLATGFSLPESVKLFEAFSDAAAFGKQSALSFGEAIRGGTEGLKNGNSILVDNTGITKNLSVILQEQGKSQKDVMNITSDASVRQAIYNGLLKEAQGNIGDADKLTQGYTGSVASLDQAYKLLNTAVGDYITQNPAIVAANKVQAEQVRELTGLLTEQGTETQQTAADWILMYAKIKAAAIPFGAAVKNIFAGVFAGLSTVAAGALGLVAGAVEAVFETFKVVSNSIANTFADVYNTIIGYAQKIPTSFQPVIGGLKELQTASPITSRLDTNFDFNITEKLFGGMRKAADAATTYEKKLTQSVRELDTALGDLDTYQQAIKQDRESLKRKKENDKVFKEFGSYNEFGGDLTEADKRAIANNNSGNATTLIPLGGKGGDKTAATDKLKETFMTWKDLKKITENLGFTVTSTTGGRHNENSKHGKGLAIDVRTKDKSADQIAWFMEEMRKAGVYVKDERVRPKGQKVWDGEHLHLEDGRLQGMGKGSKTDDFDRFVSDKSNAITKAQRDAKTRGTFDIFKKLGFTPGELLDDFTNLMVEDARKNIDVGEQFGVKLGKGYQPTKEEVGRLFDANRSKGQSEVPDVPAELSGNITSRPTLDENYIKNLRVAAGLETEKADEATRYGNLYLRELSLMEEVSVILEDQALSRKEATVQAQIDYQIALRRNIAEEANLAFAESRAGQLNEIKNIEAALSTLRQQNADDQFVEQRRLLASKREQIGLEQDISDLQDKIANQSENAALRYRAAWLKAVYDVKDADTRAIESQIESQVRIADAGKIHVEQIRADVLDAMASQKTMSETIADEIVGIYEKIGEASDKFLDKTIGKIPIIGGVAKTLARNALTKITGGILDAILPGGSDAFQSTGNPLLDENISQTKVLKSIDKKLGTGSVLGGLTGRGRSSGSGGGAWDTVADILGGRGSSASGGSSGLTSDNMWDQIRGGTFAGDITGGRGGAGGSIFDRLKSVFGKGNGGLLGKGGIFGEKGFGNNAGTYGAFGSIAQMLGGMLGGRAGTALAYAGTGLQIGSMFGGPIGGAIGAGVGALIGFLTGGTRKKDEKARNQGMLDALGSIDKLIAEVNNNPDFSDATGIISQGAGIKQSYLEAMNQLKDKKTRNIALKDVSRIDEKLRTLETLAKEKASKTKSRQESLIADVPTFADGGAISDFAMKNFPNGFISGPGTGRSDSILARVSNGEYILDATTVANIGTQNLDKLRAAQGKMKYVKTPYAYADGGSIGAPVVIGQSGATVSGSEQPPKVENNFYFQENGRGEIEGVKAETYWTSPEGKRMLINSVVQDIRRNRGESEIVKGINDVNSGRG